jgi:hypothetical protein
MDTHPDRPDDLSPLERRLSAWRPADAGLDADAMLFAAGRASARPGPGRFVWPALSGLLGVFVVVLGAWLTVERSERLALAQQLRRQTPVVPPSPAAPAVPVEPNTVDAPMPDSYLSSRQALEKGLEAWPPQSQGRAGSTPVPVNHRVYQVGNRDILLDP